jgi:hypothetical protein
MYSFNESFLKLEEERISLRKLNSKLTIIDSEINKVSKSLESLKETLSKEKKDVNNLKSFTLTYLFYKIKGSIDEKLSKEKFEFLEAQAKFIETEDYLNRLISNKKSILNDINDIGNIDLKYDDLLTNSAQYVLNLNNEESKKYHWF